MSFLEDVTDQLNLRWAWEKVRRASIPGDVWIDEIELASFEVQLESNLQRIASELRRGRYRLRPLRPMAFPKQSDKNGSPQVRQYFNVSISDQVAWTAVVNVIGPHLDSLMPAWSYGNRLFRSIWVDEEGGIRQRKIGRYRHSSGKIYLPFGQSWPVFRRHVFLATSAMTTKINSVSSGQMAVEDSDELSLQEHLKAEHRCPFVRKEYWNERDPKGGKENLYWCSVDLEKFYPSISLDVVLKNIIDFIPLVYKDEAQKLLPTMLRFSIDSTGWSPGELKAIALKPRQEVFMGIPTGLHVAGFLANVGLLKVDIEVAERLKTRDVAHFRFVDDHVILAYSFEDLVKWVDEYLKLLSDSETGAKVNTSKIEPQELAVFFTARLKSLKRAKDDAIAAAKACKINPEFPTPLMTKTLALVSAIARTDFNLLEESELVALTDQLEHMLLVELPEAEIPEKTRLSFAAIRLMRLAECRLSNDARSAELACRQQALDAELTKKEGPLDRREFIEEESRKNDKLLEAQLDKLDKEVGRAFGLLRKVLQERPDRVRLWTRAIQMCRQTGAKGLKDILDDIARVGSEHKNVLAAEYLLANTLALLGSEAIAAARMLCDTDTAEWKKRAARRFFREICSAPLRKPSTSERSWFLKASWDQFCFGLFCAHLILQIAPPNDDNYEIKLPNDFIAKGEKLLFSRSDSSPVNWAWWAARSSLFNLSSRASGWVVEIANRLPQTPESHSLWRFFPFDVPSDVLRRMQDDKIHSRHYYQMAGWWHDAFVTKDKNALPDSVRSNHDAARALKNIRSAATSRSIPLQQWCDEIRTFSSSEITDPRLGEWTALEIVRQIGLVISSGQSFNFAYVLSVKTGNTPPLCLHPANFRVPSEWLTKQPLTWSKWLALMRPNDSPAVEIVPKKLRIVDSRYTPISSSGHSLFDSINQVRGLGLLLYGLLKHNFELPALWNGPGHRDILNMLPRLLLREMTCSSWTLGIMQACLQPRALENLFFRVKPTLAIHLDDDSLHDPLCLLTSRQVCDAIEKCQSVLVRNQLSTINHKARQLTPISIRQLSHPNWTKEYDDTIENSAHEH